jgi:hypothetical protein
MMTDNQKKVAALKWMLNQGGGNRVWFNQLRKRWRERTVVNPFSSKEWSKLVELWEAAPSSGSVQPGGCTAGREASQGFRRKELPPLAAPAAPVTEKELEQIVVTHGLVTPYDLIVRFPRRSSWSPQLFDAIQCSLQGHYLFEVVEGADRYVTSRCPNEPKIVMIVLMNLIGSRHHLAAEIIRLYPDLTPQQS